MTSIGENLRALRISKNLSQAEVAQKIGVSSETVMRIEKGDKKTSLSNILNYCSFLEVTLHEITSPTFFVKGPLEPVSNFQKKLQDFMTIKNLTRRELSKISGIEYVTLSSYLTGIRQPSPDSLEKLCKALSLQLSDLSIQVDVARMNQLDRIEQTLREIQKKLEP
jgi:transcriptional regulator with XRE-family HTH domain